MITTLSDISSNVAIAINATFSEKKHAQRLFANMAYHDARWMREYKTIILSVNGDKEYADYFEKEFSPIFPNHETVVLYTENLGKYLGNADNTNKIFEYTSQKSDIEYILKMSLDVMGDHLDQIIIDTDYDFFYINNIHCRLSQKYSKEELLTKISNNDYFLPINHYYVIKNKIKTLYPNNEKILQLKNDSFENIETTDDTEDICNEWLAELVRINNLKTKNMLSESDMSQTIDYVYQYNMIESHKNIVYHSMGDICHYHYEKFPILDIPNDYK